MALDLSANIQSLKRPEFEIELSKLTKYKPNSWQRIVRESDARFKIICVGRRGGKSFYVVNDSKDGLVSDLVLPNQKVWIVAPNYDLTQIVWNELYTMAVSHFRPIIKKIHNNKGNFKIQTYLNTTIEAKSAEEWEKLVGVGLTKIIVDEAALLKEKTWTQSLRPTLIDHKGRTIFISTPKGKNWFWGLWMKGQAKEDVEWASWRFTSYDNEYLDRGELEKVTKDMPDYEMRQEILANFEETAEQVFRKFREAAKGELAGPQKGHRYQFGLDLGRKSSYSVISIVDEMEYPFRLVYFDRFKTIDWNLQVERVKAVWNKYPTLRVRTDATGEGDPVCEKLEERGVRVEPFIYKETSKKQLIDKLAIMIEEGSIIYPKIDILLKEMEVFGREISKETGRIKYKPLTNFTDDCVNSLALACWGLYDRPRKVIKDEEPRKYSPISEITGY